MDVQYLRDNRYKLIAYMENEGYSADYIININREINHVIDGAESKKWASYEDVYLEYTKKSNSPDYLRNKRTFLGIIDHFDVHRRFPDGRRRHNLVKRGKYHLLSEEFKSAIDYYCAAEKKRGKKASTINVESSNVACLFFDLQQEGISTLSEITEDAVLSIFITQDGTFRRGCSFKKNVSAVFKACVSKDSDAFNRILAFLPELREKRKNIQYLTPDEIISLKQKLHDVDSPLSFRDRAIGILALYTGLRCCDIAGLTLSSIDWSNDLLFIKQQKTSVPFELPLKAIVGNAIYDYLYLERPQTECEYLFISNHRPYGRMKSGSFGNVANKLMKAANIRQSSGERRGFHIFRHHLATELLGNDVPLPIISRVLGHNSPDSLDTYLSADFKHLKECALSIEKFPMAKGVFGNA